MNISNELLDIRLHTGYADLRFGAFVPRWKVQAFLTQLGKSGLVKENIHDAEHYFAIWMNQYPWLLSNPPYLASGQKATDYDVKYPAALDSFTVKNNLLSSLFIIITIM